MFKAPFSFNGRIRRTEFGLTYIVYIIAVIAISALMEIGGDSTQFFGLLFIPVIWFFWAQGAKRCHDRGNTGWYQIIPFYVFWMLFAESDNGENEYGQNPKGIGNTNDINEIGKHHIE